MLEHEEQLAVLFGEWATRPVFAERQGLLRATRGDSRRLLRTLPLEYVAPADASRLPYGSASFDCHVSRSVLEHIPTEVLPGILREGARLLRPGGLFIHLVDFSDHFSHADGSISPINFLQYSDRDWSRIAPGRYAHVNRLRIDDYAPLFAQAGLALRMAEVRVDSQGLEKIGRGIPLAEPFAQKEARVNATTSAVFIAERNQE